MTPNLIVLFTGLESSNSDGIQNSTSEVRGCYSPINKPSLDVKHIRVTKSMNKLQILSPISDKSQEQTYSPSSDNNGKSGTGTPRDQKHDCCTKLGNKDLNKNFSIKKLSLETWCSEDWKLHNADQRNRKVNLNLNLNVQDVNNENSISFKTLRTPDIQQYLNVPWDMPKLKKKLKNKNYCFRGQTSSPETSPKRKVLPKSPDVKTILSGDLENEMKLEERNFNIKFWDFSEVTSNQALKTPELEQYLEVPWEVPKLKKKLAGRKKKEMSFNIQGSDSGISMSSQENKDLLNVPLFMPKLNHRSSVHVMEFSNLEKTEAKRKEGDSDSITDSKRAGSPVDSFSLSLPRGSVNANDEFNFRLNSVPDNKINSSESLDNTIHNNFNVNTKTENIVSNEGENKSTRNENLDFVKSKVKTECLYNDLPNDIMDLPFSMPKLHRKVQECRTNSFNALSHISTRVELGKNSPNLSLEFNRPNLRHPVEHLRPLSLDASSHFIKTKPSVMQLNLPLQRPGKFTL